jgi:hypothetical protein
MPMVSSAAYEQDPVVDGISDEIGQTVSLVSQRALSTSGANMQLLTGRPFSISSKLDEFSLKPVR